MKPIVREKLFSVLISVTYGSFLFFIYKYEISEDWSYMGFDKITSPTSLIVPTFLLLASSLLSPATFSTRSILILIFHYGFFVPSLVFSASVFGSDTYVIYLTSLVIFWVALVFVSSVRLPRLKLRQISRKKFLFLVLFMLAICVFMIAAFGGLRSFNLNPLRVYEFRAAAASDLPAIFGYIVSGVSKVVVPLCILLAIYFRSYTFVYISIILILLMFGMLHHKSMILLPIVVALFFYLFRKWRTLRVISILFVSIASISAMELIYLDLVESNAIPLFTAFITRRALFTPPLLDFFHISFFDQGQYLYWSTSKFGLGIARNPYDLSAPFLIGRDYFGNDAMSANTGIIGSGFSHAGLIGVSLYSLLAGLLVAFFQSYGRALGASRFLTALSTTEQLAQPEAPRRPSADGLLRRV